MIISFVIKFDSTLSLKRQLKGAEWLFKKFQTVDLHLLAHVCFLLAMKCD